uniref:Ig-like domain-containing protein n=1 Tax=Oreochromis niloticus TaxID=8128 RepID=I3IYY2_ORENI
MGNVTFVTGLLLFSLGWFSVSDSQTLEVKSGEEVTLLCSNFSSSPTLISWFRVTKRAKLTCIASMFKPHEPASFCTGFQSEKFQMSTNISTVFLKIKQVDLLDSGLYFCGFRMSYQPVIVEATNVEVQGVLDGLPKVMSMILGALTVILFVAIICLALQIKRLKKAIVTNLDTDERNRRTGSQREVQSRTETRTERTV